MNDDKPFDPGPLIDADCQPSGERWTLVFVRPFAHPPEAVWAALTDPARLRAWAPFTADRDLGRPGPAILTMIDGAEAEDLPASVRAAVPPTRLEYTWGDDLLHWELERLDAGTRATLQHTVEARDWVPKVAAGWHLCLFVAERLLDDRPIAPIRGAEAMDYGWQGLADAYAERLGIVA